MKTIFGRKSLPAIENQELCVERMWIAFLLNKGLFRYRRSLRGRPQPRRAADYGSITRYRSRSRKTEALQGSRYLPGDSASLELVDDRTGDVAVVPATSEASAV